MKTKECSVQLPRKARPSGIESVSFHDGMLVSADDLDTAARYPVSLLQSVLRAYLGCGVVCGFGLRVRRTVKGEPAWVLCVDRGLAIDCEGYPIELCAPVELDLTPDPCACEPPPPTVLIAVRRTTSDETSHRSDDANGCGRCRDDDAHECGRVREHTLVRAFTPEELDALSVCRRTPADRPDDDVRCDDHGDQSYETERRGWCEVLTTCPSCCCEAEWILLGAVTLDENRGIVGEPDHAGRRWVKPVEAMCAADRATTELAEKVAALEDAVSRLGKSPAARKAAGS
jgi:hypothetical protein